MATAFRGPDAVKAALIEAATDLFAGQGDASIRAVAARAGVNHGLVHHYFGGKSGLRAAVLDRLAKGMHASLDVPPSSDTAQVGRAALRVTEQDPRMVKILARALLDGELPQQLQSVFPVVARLLAARSPVDRGRTKAAIAEGLAMALGAVVFGSWIRVALGLSDAEFEQIRDEAIQRGMERLEGEP
ncbi:MAG: TetR/AcrR family transcriptional regulator [Myxococcota bacterium]